MTKYRSISEPFSPVTVEKRQFDLGEILHSCNKNNNTEENAEKISSEEENNVEDYYEFRKWCGIRRSTVLLIFYVVSYFSYLLLGGYIMSVLETPNEMDIKNKTRKRKEEFLRNNPNVNRTEFEELLSLFTESSGHGIGISDEDLDDNNWSLGQSFLFTVTVVTTVGYGHIVPLTPGGKLFCTFFAAFGIPFTLVFLSASVQRLLFPTLRFLAWMMSGKLGNVMSPLGVRLVHLLLLAAMFGIFIVLIPTVIFMKLENGANSEHSWSLLDAFYYVFISLTTIGLGDYIPGDNNGQELRDLYKASVALYLLLGMVLMSLTLTVFYDIPQLNLGFNLHTYSDIRLPTKNTTGYKDDTISTSTTITSVSQK